MGSYLIVGGKENNSKSISYSMIVLMREILPEKKSLYGEIEFVVKLKEVAKILYGINDILSNEWTLKEYIRSHSGEYGMNNDFEKIKDDFEWIHRCFAKTLSEMVVCNKKKVVCEWK